MPRMVALHAWISQRIASAPLTRFKVEALMTNSRYDVRFQHASTGARSNQSVLGSQLTVRSALGTHPERMAVPLLNLTFGAVVPRIHMLLREQDRLLRCSIAARADSAH